MEKTYSGILDEWYEVSWDDDESKEDWILVNVGCDAESIETNANITKGTCLIYGEITTDGCKEETMNTAEFTYDSETGSITITGLPEEFTQDTIDEVKEILLDNLKTNFLR